MASIVRESNGRKRIDVMVPGRGRQHIRLGDMSMDQAGTWKIRIKDLAASANGGGAVQDETARWLRDLPDEMHARIVAAGLVAPRQNASTATAGTVGSFIDEYLASRADCRPGTMLVFQQARKHLGTGPE